MNKQYNVQFYFENSKSIFSMYRSVFGSGALFDPKSLLMIRTEDVGSTLAQCQRRTGKRQ